MTDSFMRVEESPRDIFIYYINIYLQGLAHGMYSRVYHFKNTTSSGIHICFEWFFLHSKASPWDLSKKYHCLKIVHEKQNYKKDLY